MKHLLTRVTLTLAMQLTLAGFDAQARPQPMATPESGRWITQSGNLEIEIAPCGMTLCGTVVRVMADKVKADKTMGAAMAAPADAGLPAPPSPLGKQILFDLQPVDSGGLRGKIYNRGDNKIYNSLVVADGPDQLKLTIYTEVADQGIVQLWQRTAAMEQP